MSAAHVAVIGGGLAGMSAAVALADEGLQVTLFERHPRLGGRATSYLLPNGEYIDNCQHVTLRCCCNLEDFYHRVGVEKSIHYYDRLAFTDSKARRAAIRAYSLPAPLHLIPSFAAFRLLSWKDKWSIARAMLRILFAGGTPELNGSISMRQWLQHNHQTQNAIDRFWRVVLVSALNEQLERIDAVYGIAVFWKAFLANRTGFGVGIPSVPLADLYRNAAERIERHGAVRARCGVSQLQFSGDHLAAIRLDDGTDFEADYYVTAIPFDRLLKLLPDPVRHFDVFSALAKLNVSPITSVHMWFDRQVMSEPFLASVDQTIQWVFNKSLLAGENNRSGTQYLQVVISASHVLSQRSQQEVIDLCRREVGELLPQVATAKLNRAVVIRENAATFSVEPGCDQWRPGPQTPIRNLFLAGDWTRTDWPATMESAVRSGYRAAEAILSLGGKQVQLVQPELKPTGLSAWFAR
jgi:zeta-carotene desaturase